MNYDQTQATSTCHFLPKTSSDGGKVHTPSITNFSKFKKLIGRKISDPRPTAHPSNHKGVYLDK